MMKKHAIIAGLIIFLAAGAWGQTVLWTGGATGSWNVPGNWLPFGVPGSTDDVLIPLSVSVELTAPASVASIFISSGATLDLGSHEFTSTGAITNAGTLRLVGNANQLVGPHTIIDGTVEFIGGGTTFAGITSFGNLTILSGNRTITANTSVAGNFFHDVGSLALGSNTLTFSGSGAIGRTPGGNITINGSAGSAVTISGNRTLGADLAIGTVSTVPTVNITGNLNAGAARTITVSNALWNRTGTFTHGNGTVIFDNTVVTGNNTGGNAFFDVTTSGTVSFLGSNTFSSLDADASTVAFPSGSTQTIPILTALGATLMSGGAGHWNLAGLLPANLTTNAATVIQWCRSANFLNRTSGVNINAGSTNNILVLAGGTFTWGGVANTVWDNDANWVDGAAPPDDLTQTIVIPAGTPNSPVVSQKVYTGVLTVASGATIDLAGQLLEVDTVGGLTNGGTIMLHGVANQVLVNGAAPAGVTGTIHYHNNALATWVFGNTYVNLVLADNVTMPLTSNLTVSGTTSLGADIFTIGAQFYGGLVTLTGVFGDTRGLNGTTVTLEGGALGTDQILHISGDAVLGGDVTGMMGLTITGSATLIGTLLDTRILGAADWIWFNGPVIGNGLSLQLNGHPWFDGNVNGVANLGVTGNSNIRTNEINTTGAQTYGDLPTRQVNLGTVVGAGPVRTLNGATVTLPQVNGGGLSLTINGNAVFNGNVTNLADLTVTGTSSVGANITTTGAQLYTGLVTLTGGAGVTRTLTPGTTATVTLTGGATGDGAGGQSLLINGAAVLGGNVNNVANLTIHQMTTLAGIVPGTRILHATGWITFNGGKRRRPFFAVGWKYGVSWQRYRRSKFSRKPIPPP
ncbi:MAG: hypothetical protein FWC65_00690 [Treponema sp.]|nr:hypothetical protein [Treponema sp.]